MTTRAAARLRTGSLDSLLGLQLRLAQLRFFEAFFAEFTEAGITPAEYAILVLVDENPGIRQGVLGEVLRIKRSNMTKVVRGLESRDLVARMAPVDDGRALEMRLTGKGRALRRLLSGRVKANDAAAASCLDQGERAELLRLLRKLTASHRAAKARREEVAYG